MAIKFTDAKKWDDVWFSELTMEQKVMFMYLCDVCDIAGFYEVNCRLVSLRTGIEDVRGTIKSLSKSVLFKDNYVFIKKHIKHQRNLPLNLKNKAHIGIIKSLMENQDRFPEIYDTLPSQDANTIILYKSDPRGIQAPIKGDVSPTSIGTGNSNTITADTAQSETKITRLYKYFIGEDNLMGQSITEPMRKITAKALDVMDVEDWKKYCDLRLQDKYQSSPTKFFLEDGWRRFQDKPKAKEPEYIKKKKQEASERASMPHVTPPEDFKKELVKIFGKRSRPKTTADTTS